MQTLQGRQLKKPTERDAKCFRKERTEQARVRSHFQIGCGKKGKDLFYFPYVCPRAVLDPRASCWTKS